MGERLIEIIQRLPRGFYRRLLRVAKATSEQPEEIVDRGLRTEESRAGLTTDSDFERNAVSKFHANVARQTAVNLGEEGRSLRARKGGYGKQAKAAGLSLEAFIEREARARGVTVEEFLKSKD